MEKNIATPTTNHSIWSCILKVNFIADTLENQKRAKLAPLILNKSAYSISANSYITACLIFTEKNIFKKPGFTWILWWTSGDVTSWTTPGAWLQENTEPTERFWPWHPKKMISDSQKITIPSTPTAAASTLQYFHLHRGFKACNDVNYVKKKEHWLWIWFIFT